MRERIGEHFDGDVAIEPGVGGAINRAHSAFAELGDDFVVSNGLLWAHQARCREYYHFLWDDAQTGVGPYFCAGTVSEWNNSYRIIGINVLSSEACTRRRAE